MQFYFLYKMQNTNKIMMIGHQVSTLYRLKLVFELEVEIVVGLQLKVY